MLKHAFPKLKGMTAGHQSKARYFFVGGGARSGTTLLQNVLCSDSSTNPLIFEAAPVRFLLEPYRSLTNHIEQYPGVYFDSTEQLNEFYSQALRLFLEKLRKKYTCENLVLKEPQLTKLFPVIHELLANDSRFLCIVRDPRAAIASMLLWGERARLRGEKHVFQERDIEDLSKFYNAFYLPLFNCKSPGFSDRMTYIRYEDLVLKPEKSVRVLKEVTGLKLDLLDIHGAWPNSQIDFNDPDLPIRNSVTELYGKAISSDQVSAFVDVLTIEEIKAIERRCWLIFRDFGYERL